MRSIVTAVLIALICACSRQKSDDPKDSAAVARKASELATTPEQKRLWNEAAERAGNAQLEKLPQPEQPVRDRKAVAAPNRAVKPEKPVEFPENAVTALRILQAPPQPIAYRGTARVMVVKDQRVELDLGEGQLLAFLARAGGNALKTKAGDQAQIEYRSQDDPHDRQEILAVRLPGNEGIVSVVDGGTTPVTVEVAMYNLTARQVGSPANSMMDVQVRVGGVTKVLKSGQTAEFPGLTVGVKASNAYEGAERFQVEGNPFTLDLIAWPTGGTPP